MKTSILYSLSHFGTYWCNEVEIAKSGKWIDWDHISPRFTPSHGARQTLPY